MLIFFKFGIMLKIRLQARPYCLPDKVFAEFVAAAISSFLKPADNIISLLSSHHGWFISFLWKWTFMQCANDIAFWKSLWLYMAFFLFWNWIWFFFHREKVKARIFFKTRFKCELFNNRYRNSNYISGKWLYDAQLPCRIL